MHAASEIDAAVLQISGFQKSKNAMKIILYGTCSYPFFYRELIRQASERGATIDWRVLILWWRHKILFEGILAPEKLFYVPDSLNALLQKPMPDTSGLHS